MQAVAERLIDMPLQRQFVVIGVFSAAISMWDGDWLVGVVLIALWAIWATVPATDGPPILALALTFQWVQATSGVLYAVLTGRLVGAMLTPHYRDIVLLSLGCVLALAVGLRFGASYFMQQAESLRQQSSVRIGWPLIIASYVVPLALEPTLMELAFQYPAIGQGILALRFVRLAALYLLLRRFVQASAWHFFAMLMIFELFLGFTSFYAGFREPMVAAIAAVLERFHPRHLWHWAALVMIVLCGSLLALVWLGIRESYRPDFDSDLLSQTRQARATRFVELGTAFLQRDHSDMVVGMDELVDRMWAVNYPSMVLERVPDSIPHTGGELLSTALQHVFMPRLLFPNKPALQSDSENVRRYAGVYVAGEEQGTSIAFGYVAESYVDFGLPVMFLPSLAWGFVLGGVFGWLNTQIQTRELRIGLITVVFWIALYLFERSWAKTMGSTGTLLIYFGLPVLLLDRIVFRKDNQSLQHGPAPAGITAHSHGQL